MILGEVGQDLKIDNRRRELVARVLRCILFGKCDLSPYVTRVLRKPSARLFGSHLG
jgi:hypothetical protein